MRVSRRTSNVLTGVRRQVRRDRRRRSPSGASPEQGAPSRSGTGGARPRLRDFGCQPQVLQHAPNDGGIVDERDELDRLGNRMGRLQ